MWGRLASFDRLLIGPAREHVKLTPQFPMLAGRPFSAAKIDAAAGIARGVGLLYRVAHPGLVDDRPGQPCIGQRRCKAGDAFPVDVNGRVHSVRSHHLLRQVLVRRRAHDLVGLIHTRADDYVRVGVAATEMWQPATSEGFRTQCTAKRQTGQQNAPHHAVQSTPRNGVPRLVQNP